MNRINKDYLKEIDSLSLLSLSEEKELIAAAKAGSVSARNKLVESNLKIVIKVAHKYKNCFLELDDLVEEGNIGLIKAVEKFNPAVKVRFITYAVWWIRDSIQKAIRDTGCGIRFPASKFNEMKELKVDSFDEIWDVEKNRSLHDTVKDVRFNTPEEEYCEKMMFLELDDAFNTLSDKERDIIEKRFGFKSGKAMSLSEVGLEMGLSKERVRQIEHKALSEMYELLAS